MYLYVHIYMFIQVYGNSEIESEMVQVAMEESLGQSFDVHTSGTM